VLEKTKAKATKTIEEVMGISIAKIDPKAPLNTISEWDSFNNLMLISKFQEEYNIEFTALEIENAKTLADVFALLDKKIKQ